MLQVVEAARAWRPTRPRAALRPRMASLVTSGGLLQAPRPSWRAAKPIESLGCPAVRPVTGAVSLAAVGLLRHGLPDGQPLRPARAICASSSEGALRAAAPLAQVCHHALTASRRCARAPLADSRQSAHPQVRRSDQVCSSAAHPRASAARPRFPSCMIADTWASSSLAAYECKQAPGGGGAA